jgi:hypothetical protein
LKGGQAVKYWTPLGMFAIKLLVPTRRETPRCGVGVDHGVVAEGYAVVCGWENVLAVMLQLPDKAHIVRKLKERRRLRRSRRYRKTRRRPARYSNRRPGPGWIAPSQLVLVLARERMMQALCALYPIRLAGVEDVRFDHRKKWGKAFSTVEIGKARLHDWWHEHGINACYYRGYETKEKREEYGYRKTYDKGAEVFTAHCTDARPWPAPWSLLRRWPPAQ